MWAFIYDQPKQMKQIYALYNTEIKLIKLIPIEEVVFFLVFFLNTVLILLKQNIVDCRKKDFTGLRVSEVLLSA